MIKRFLLAWGLYWLAVFLMPVSSIYESVVGAFMLQLGFVIIVAGVIYAGTRLLELKEPSISDDITIQYARVISWASVLLSIIGLCLLMYDKIYIQGIDYTRGLSVARYQWWVFSEARAGKASSIYSAIGYLLGSFYFVTALLAVTQVKNIVTIERYILLALSFALVMANSLLTGGRSSVLLLLIFIFCIFALYNRESWWTLLFSGLRGLSIVCMLLISCTYVIYVFYGRADNTGVSIQNYTLQVIKYLSLEPGQWFVEMLNTGFLGEVAAILVLCVSYITHSFSVTAAIIESSINEDSVIIFIHAANLLYKIGLIDRPDGSWFLSGLMLSFPGSLWLQFGLIGFILSSFMVGFISVMMKFWLSVSPNQLLPLGFYAASETVLILSPALFAGDFISFPFVLFAFVFTAIVLEVYKRWQGRSNKLVLHNKADKYK